MPRGGGVALVMAARTLEARQHNQRPHRPGKREHAQRRRDDRPRARTAVRPERQPREPPHAPRVQPLCENRAGTLNLTDAETTIVDTRIRAYIYEKADFYGHHPEVHDQILRFWHLAIPELLRNLENRNEDIQSFVFNILVQMRNERVVRIMINKAKACKPSNLKDMYIGTLGIMTQQEDMNLPNRQCLNEKDSQELFSKIIEPALKELSPETVKAIKD